MLGLGYQHNRDIAPVIENQMENEMETLVPFEGVHKDYREMRDFNINGKIENGMET